MGLFAPKWLSKNEDKALEAVKTAIVKNDQPTLARIAVEALFPKVRAEAVKRLKDQTMLARFALEDRDDKVRSSAFDAVSDQAVLAQMYAAVRDEKLRGSIVRKITGQQLLKKIAQSDASMFVRGQAIKGIQDDAFLWELIRDDPSNLSAVKGCAVDQISDQGILADFIRSELKAHDALKINLISKNPNERSDFYIMRVFDALKKIENDQPLFAEVLRMPAKTSDGEYERKCRHMALENLKDEALLRSVVLDGNVTVDYRLAAAKKIENRLSEDDLVSLAMGCRDSLGVSFVSYELYQFTLDRITDQDKLLYIVNHTQSMRMRVEAMSRLADTSGVTFWTDREHCPEHDQMHIGYVRMLPAVNGKRQCPFCGEPLTYCNYGSSLSEPIRDEDQPE